MAAHRGPLLTRELYQPAGDGDPTAYHWKRAQAEASAVIDKAHTDPDTARHVLAMFTGDLGYMDEDGFYFIVDRAKALVIRGGYNVYPRGEIEEVLHAHPAILEAAVIGKSDERLGEEVVAMAWRQPWVPRPSCHVLSTKILISRTKTFVGHAQRSIDRSTEMLKTYYGDDWTHTLR